MTRGRPEAQLQKTCAEYLAWVLQKSVVWSAIGHGVVLGNSARDRAIRGKMLKDMGVRPGVPDIYIAWRESRGDTFSQQTLWIELKSKEGRQSDEQCAFEVAVQAIGHSYYIVRSPDALMEILRNENVPMKGKRR